MLYVIAAVSSGGIWTDTFGLLFTFAISLPVLAIGCIIVAIIAGRGEKRADEELRGRWGRKHAPKP